MGRDFSFQWQPPSQWGEIVRLGMGHPFKTLLVQPLNKNIKTYLYPDSRLPQN